MYKKIAPLHIHMYLTLLWLSRASQCTCFSHTNTYIMCWQIFLFFVRLDACGIHSYSNKKIFSLALNVASVCRQAPPSLGNASRSSRRPQHYYSLCFLVWWGTLSAAFRLSCQQGVPLSLLLIKKGICRRLLPKSLALRRI